VPVPVVVPPVPQPPRPQPTPPQEVIAVAWVKTSEDDSNANAWDHYEGPEGRAMVYRNGDNIEGKINGNRFSVPRPPEGNVQQLRIKPRADGWYVFTWVDPRDGRRSEWEEKVM